MSRQRARAAVTVLFIINSLAVTSWIPRVAEIQSSLRLSDAQLGLVLACAAAGGLVVGPAAGLCVARWGSATVSVVAFVLLTPSLMLIGSSTSGWMLGVVLLWWGAADAVMDAAMNAHGLRVQGIYGRSVINGFHAFWSLGTVAGALIGALCLALGVPVTTMMTCLVVVSLLALTISARWLLPGADPHADDRDEEARTVAEASADPGELVPTESLRGKAIRATSALGLFTVLALFVEDVPSRWSSVYLTSISAPLSMVGLGLTAFTLAMTIGRFTGDRLVDRLGAPRLARIGMAVSAPVLALALVMATPWTYVIACTVIGLGTATLYPAAVHAAAHIPGLRPAMGVSSVLWISRGGFVLAPLVVGVVADRAGIGWGIAVAVVAAVALIPLSTVLRPTLTVRSGA
jgi:MFS family permease